MGLRAPPTTVRSSTGRPGEVTHRSHVDCSGAACVAAGAPRGGARPLVPGWAPRSPARCWPIRQTPTASADRLRAGVRGDGWRPLLAVPTDAAEAMSTSCCAGRDQPAPRCPRARVPSARRPKRRSLWSAGRPFGDDDQDAWSDRLKPKSRAGTSSDMADHPQLAAYQRRSRGRVPLARRRGAAPPSSSSESGKEARSIPRARWAAKTPVGPGVVVRRPTSCPVHLRRGRNSRCGVARSAPVSYSARGGRSSNHLRRGAETPITQPLSSPPNSLAPVIAASVSAVHAADLPNCSALRRPLAAAITPPRRPCWWWPSPDRARRNHGRRGGLAVATVRHPY